MLDGKRYYAVFTDEDPANRKPVLYYSPNLIAAWRDLEKELRPLVLGTKSCGLGSHPVLRQFADNRLHIGC
jgi:hypothetical protein